MKILVLIKSISDCHFAASYFVFLILLSLSFTVEKKTMVTCSTLITTLYWEY